MRRLSAHGGARFGAWTREAARGAPQQSVTPIEHGTTPAAPMHRESNTDALTAINTSCLIDQCIDS